MNDVREIVLYFGDGSKLVPVDIAKGLTDRYPDEMLPPDSMGSAMVDDEDYMGPCSS